MNRGAFIVCEGIDGAGKTHLAKQLQDTLENNVSVKSPSGIFREMISSSYGHISLQSWQYLWIAEMVNLWDTQINPALKKGKNVIVDRWSWVSRPVYAYALTDIPFAATVQAIEKVMLEHDIRKPDIILLLDAPMNVLEERISERKVDYLSVFEKENVMERVREAYVKVSKILKGTRFKKIASHREPEKILQEVLKELKTEGLYVERSVDPCLENRNE